MRFPRYNLQLELARINKAEFLKRLAIAGSIATITSLIILYLNWENYLNSERERIDDRSTEGYDLEALSSISSQIIYVSPNYDGLTSTRPRDEWFMTDWIARSNAGGSTAEITGSSYRTGRVETFGFEAFGYVLTNLRQLTNSQASVSSTYSNEELPADLSALVVEMPSNFTSENILRAVISTYYVPENFINGDPSLVRLPAAFFSSEERTFFGLSAVTASLYSEQSGNVPLESGVDYQILRLGDGDYALWLNERVVATLADDQTLELQIFSDLHEMTENPYDVALNAAIFRDLENLNLNLSYEEHQALLAEISDQPLVETSAEYASLHTYSLLPRLNSELYDVPLPEFTESMLNDYLRMACTESTLSFVTFVNEAYHLGLIDPQDPEYQLIVLSGYLVSPFSDETSISYLGGPVAHMFAANEATIIEATSSAAYTEDRPIDPPTAEYLTQLRNFFAYTSDSDVENVLRLLPADFNPEDVEQLVEQQLSPEASPLGFEMPAWLIQLALTSGYLLLATWIVAVNIKLLLPNKLVFFLNTGSDGNPSVEELLAAYVIMRKLYSQQSKESELYELAYGDIQAILSNQSAETLHALAALNARRSMLFRFSTPFYTDVVRVIRQYRAHIHQAQDNE